jgi:NADH:ubiquinone oxidoreductase subunit H
VLALKTCAGCFGFVWFRATLPRPKQPAQVFRASTRAEIDRGVVFTNSIGIAHPPRVLMSTLSATLFLGGWAMPMLFVNTTPLSISALVK